MTDANPDAGRGTVPALGAYFIIPILASLLTIYFLVSTAGLIWEARSNGTFIGVILLALCAAQIVRLGLQVARGEATLGLGEIVDDTQFNRQRLWLLIAMVAFVAGLPLIGTTVGLFIVMQVTMWLMGVRRWTSLLTVAVLAAASVHILLIVALGSQLPQGVFAPIFAVVNDAISASLKLITGR